MYVNINTKAQTFLLNLSPWQVILNAGASENVDICTFLTICKTSSNFDNFCVLNMVCKLSKKNRLEALSELNTYGFRQITSKHMALENSWLCGISMTECEGKASLLIAVYRSTGTEQNTVNLVTRDLNICPGL